CPRDASAYRCCCAARGRRKAQARGTSAQVGGSPASSIRPRTIARIALCRSVNSSMVLILVPLQSRLRSHNRFIQLPVSPQEMLELGQTQDADNADQSRSTRIKK